LQNRSTTFEPQLMLYSAHKAHLGTNLNKTRGADLTYSFVGAPNTKYIVRASNYYGENVGVYLIRVVPAKAYDAHEPNGDILKAKTINVGATVEASVMDKNDMDYYVLKTGDDEVSVRIDIENRSTTLRPEIGLYDANKTWVGHQINKTGGGDASYTFKAPPNTKYYIRVRDYYAEAAGDYTMTLSAEPPKNG
ncbi:MAG: hypothetical protein V3U85_00335, partial [Hyphomicrobium sp.]